MKQKVDIPSDTSLNEKSQLTKEDFYGYAPGNKFIFIPTRDLWPAKSVNDRLPDVDTGTTKDGKKIMEKPSTWIAENRSVEQITWHPGKPLLIEDKLITKGGIIDHPGFNTFNLYLPSTIEMGNPDEAEPWIDHISRIYPESCNHIIKWLAHRVQKPGEKINHALVLGGGQGIGKDTLLAPVKEAIGPWNFREASPTQLMGRFNSFVKSVILRVSEARDMGDKDRYALYEHIKTFTDTPPDVLRCDEKNIREHPVANVCGVVMTTNHKSSGIYLPEDDRRHYVAWSEATKKDFNEDHWNELWGWYQNGGNENAAAYLNTLKLDDFDAKAPPPKTSAFWEFVDAGRAPEDTDMANALNELKYPRAVTIADVKHVATPSFENWLNERKNRSKIPHRFENEGYVKVINKDANDSLWAVSGRRMTIYAKRKLKKRDRVIAAQNIT